jgi:hypothetical protein
MLARRFSFCCHSSHKTALEGSLGLRVWSCTPAYNCVERIAEYAVRTAIQAADVLQVPGVLQVAFYESHATSVVQLVPDGDGLTGKATVREGDYRRSADLQHAPDLAQYLHGPSQVIDGDADASPVELGVVKRETGIRVEVLDDEGVEPLVAAKLDLVHAEADHAPVLDLRRQVADPAAHEIQEGSAGWEEVPVQLRDGAYGPLIDVRHEPGRAVELLVWRLVGAPEGVLWYPRHLTAPSLKSHREPQLTDVRYIYL